MKDVMKDRDVNSKPAVAGTKRKYTSRRDYQHDYEDVDDGAGAD